MEQLAARRAHNPKVVWFESHSRYHREQVSLVLFFLFCLASVSTVLTSCFVRCCTASKLACCIIQSTATLPLAEQNTCRGSGSVYGGCADRQYLLLGFACAKRYPRELGHKARPSSPKVHNGSGVTDWLVPLPLHSLFRPSSPKVHNGNGVTDWLVPLPLHFLSRPSSPVSLLYVSFLFSVD